MLKPIRCFVLFGFLVIVSTAAIATDQGNVRPGQLKGSATFRLELIDMLNNGPFTDKQKDVGIINIDTWINNCQGPELDNFVDWSDMDDLKALIVTAVRAPLVCAQGVPVAEDPSAYGQKTILTLPVKGIWHVVQGNQGLVSHIRGQKGEFAWDFIINRNGYSAQGDTALNESYYCWEQPVLAPAPGTVVQTRDDLEDHRPYLPDPPHVGNHVYIDHNNGEISLLYHLQKGSVMVTVGDHVDRGQPVGLCGDTGISMFPHLHYQLFSGSLDDHTKINSRFSAYYSWRGSNDQNPDRKDIKLNLSGVPKRLDNVVNLSDFMIANVHD